MTHLPDSRSKLALLRRTVQSLTHELLTVYEELALLYSLGAQIGRLAEEDRIASRALREAMETLGADCGWVVVWEGDLARVPKGCHIQIHKRAVDRVNETFLAGLHSQGRSQVLLHSLHDVSPHRGTKVPAPFMASELAVGKTSFGYICLGRYAEDRCFKSAEQKLLIAVARQLAVVLENLRLQRLEWERQRLADELKLARNIQQSLLPHDFSVAAFLTADGISEPCFEIGGDYFDLIPISPGRVLLAIADVTGKGPPAALQAALVQGIIHGVTQRSAEPSVLMDALNECILRRAVSGNNVTAFAATLDCDGRLRYANAGHNPPLWISVNGQVSELTEGGPLLGFLANAAYREASIQLAPGDLLLLYTDGVTDSEDSCGNPLGAFALREWARSQARRSPSEVKEGLLHLIRQHSDGARQFDDLTVLIAQYRGPAAGETPLLSLRS
jgi:serine phosphatase RsbU (regulator of sigma subunit)